MQFRISFEHATREQIERGGRAAVDILKAEKVTPERLLEARHTAALWEENFVDTKERIAEVDAILAVAARADAAAVTACCAGWPAADIPETAHLEVIDDKGDRVEIGDPVEFDIFDVAASSNEGDEKRK